MSDQKKGKEQEEKWILPHPRRDDEFPPFKVGPVMLSEAKHLCAH
jgi:hypothetical protein